MIDVAVKHTILIMIAIITTLISVISYTIFVVISDAGLSNPRLFLLGENMVGADIVINAICFLLQFSFYNKEYYKICNKYHAICSICFGISSKDEQNVIKQTKLQPAAIYSASLTPVSA